MASDLSTYSDEELAAIAGGPAATAEVEPPPAPTAAAPVQAQPAPMEPEQQAMPAPDLTQVSDEDLQAAANAPALPPVGDLTKASTADLAQAAGLDPLQDFELYNAIEDEKEARAHDVTAIPTGRSIPEVFWDSTVNLIKSLPAAARGTGRVSRILNPIGNPTGIVSSLLAGDLKRDAATAMATQGNILANTAMLDELGIVGAKKATAWAKDLFSNDPKVEAEAKRASRKASWDFERESAGIKEFTDNWNQNISFALPEFLKGVAATPIDKAEAEGAAMVLDPQNFIPFGQAARFFKMIPLRGAVRAASDAVRTAAVDVARTTSAREALIAAARRAPQGELPPLLRSGGIMTAADEAAKTAGARLENARTILRRETAAQAGAIAEREARPGLLNRAAGATAESAGRATNAVGRGLQRLATVPDAIANRVAQGADETVRGTIAEGTRNVLSGLGVLPAAAGTTGLGISNVGRNIEAFGRVLGQAEGQLPFFKTLARETDGLTSWGASLVDQSGLARVVVPAARTVGDVARGLPTNAALALIQSGGDPDKAAEALASGLVFGMAGSGVGQWHRYGNPEAFKRQQLGDVNRYRQTLPTEEARTFYGRLPGAERAALATMQLAHPDLKIKYVSQGKGRPSMYYMAEDGPVAVINMDTRDPISAVVAHEVGHHIERHGLGPQIERVLFGDPLLKQPGLFTQLDAQGHPVLAPDGTYAKTSEWAGLREAYNERVRALAEMTGEYVPDRNDSQIAKEFFSEHAADYLTGSNQAKLRRDLRSDVWSRAVDGLASSGLIGGKPMLKQIMGKMGMPIADGSERIVGSGLFPSGLRTSREFEELIRKYHQEVARGRGPGLIDEPAGTRYTAEEVAKHPEVLDKLFDGTDDVARDTRGRVIRNKDGSPKFTTPKEQKAQRAALAADLSAALEKSPPPGARLETVTEGGKPQEGWVVPGIPDKILNDLQASGKYNPTQLEHLRSISKAIEEGKGKSALFFYQPATRGGAQSGKYKSLAGDFRTETPYQIFVSKQGNVVVRMMSREKLMANAQNFVAKGRGGLWNNRLPELVKDVDTYLGNHAAGRPGAEGLGIEKRDQLNALFEIDTNANRAANPLMEEGARKKGIIRSRRIDRINKLTPVEEYFPTNYNSLNRNLRPEAVGSAISQ